MSRKIKIQTVNTKNLEETLKENLKKLKSKDDCITDKIIDTTEVMQEDYKPCDILIEIKDHENNNPCIENTGDAIASTKSIHVSEEDIKTFVNDTSKEILNRCDYLDKVTVNDVLKESSISRSNINKENKEDIKKSCITAKNLIADTSLVKPKTHDKFLRHYGNVSTGEFLIDIPKENVETSSNECCTTTPYEHVNHPQHYNNYDKEVIDMMIDIWGPKETAIFCKLNAFKYRMRMGTKPDNNISQDLNKEKWYLNKYHELNSKL